jgi:hypothetical protein
LVNYECFKDILDVDMDKEKIKTIDEYRKLNYISKFNAQLYKKPVFFHIFLNFSLSSHLKKTVFCPQSKKLATSEKYSDVLAIFHLYHAENKLHSMRG